MEVDTVLTIAGLLVTQLIVLGGAIFAAGKLLLGRIDRVDSKLDTVQASLRSEVLSSQAALRGEILACQTELRADIDNVGKEQQSARLELATSLAHLTGRIDEYLRVQG